MKWHDATKEFPEVIEWPGRYITIDGKTEYKRVFSSTQVLIRFIDNTDERKDIGYSIGYWVGEPGNPKGDNEWQNQDSVPFEYRHEQPTHWCYFKDIPQPEENKQ